MAGPTASVLQIIKVGMLLQWFHSKIASSALQAEAEAVLRTICIARDREWKNLLILTNCMLIVEFFFIYNRLDYSWEIETVLVDIHHLSTNSVNSDIKWTSRSQIRPHMILPLCGIGVWLWKMVSIFMNLLILLLINIFSLIRHKK